MNLYELATCANDNELDRWCAPSVSTFQECNLAVKSELAYHDDMTEKRMHMLFVWWATQ